MEISDIKVRKTFDEGALKAIVSITFDDALAVHDVKIINAKEKLFLIMPSRKNNDGSYKDIVHPINSDFRKKLESAILAKYQEELEAKKEAEEAIMSAYEDDEEAIDDEEDDEDEADEEEEF